MSDNWTIRRIIDWMTKDFTDRGIDSPRLDAELLVAEALGMRRVQLYMDLDRPLVPDELAGVRALVQRRRQREPVAYILGRRDFYGATFAVDARVLVPRPDTETVVSRALLAFPRDGGVRWLDLCTGSGAIPIAILRACPSATAVATDVSEAALEVARENAKTLGVEERIEMRHGDLFGAVKTGELFDGITSNPPYIPSDTVPTLMPEVSKHEPALALDGGRDGLDFYRRIAAESPAHLVDGGRLLLEVGEGQARAVADLLAQTGEFEPAVITRDYGDIERVVEAVRKPR